jgi:hypothetical protein
MRELYKMIDGIPIWQHLKNGAKKNNIKLVATDYGGLAEIVGKRTLNMLTDKGGILKDIFPDVEIISVKRSPRIRILTNAKIEMGDLALEIDCKDNSGKFMKKVVIFEIKHGHFQIEQNQLRRYCFMINNPDVYFHKADELKVIFMMFDRINTMKGSASYSINELDKELVAKILENSPFPEVYSLIQDHPNVVDTNIAEGLKMIME